MSTTRAKIPGVRREADVELIAHLVRAAEGYQMIYPERTADGRTGTPALSANSGVFDTRAEAFLAGALGHAPSGKDFAPWWEGVKAEVEAMIADAQRGAA